MKSAISIIFILFFKSAVSEYVIQKIDGISGLPKAIDFDSNGNAYVAVADKNKNHQLLKINPDKEILWGINITGASNINQIIINSQDVVYFDSEMRETSRRYLNILKEENLSIERIGQFQSLSYNPPMFIDEEDNIFYNGYDGITLLRPNSTTPILIKNLNRYKYLDGKDFVIDSKGNIYIAVLDSFGIASTLAVVTKEAKLEETPYATHYELNGRFLVDCLAVDQNGDAWVFAKEPTSSTTYIRKLSNSNITDIPYKDEYVCGLSKAVKDRVYVFSIPTSDVRPVPIHFWTLDGRIHQIPELVMKQGNSGLDATIVNDKDGLTYIACFYGFQKGKVVVVKTDEGKATEITFPDYITFVNMILDENDDLWIVTAVSGVYRLKKGDTEAVKVTDRKEVETDLTGAISINKKTNEVFVLGNSGVYFVSNNSV